MTTAPLPLVLAGPTASGKSALALEICSRDGGEVVCADSRQLFRGMLIGAAGPSGADCATVPHHGYGVLEPGAEHDAQQFVDDTLARVAEIQGRGKRPVLVGGAGLYLRSLRFGLQDVPGRDPEVRARLDTEVAERGSAALHQRLAAADPIAAAAIDPADPVRVVRALEILEVSGQAPSSLRTSHSDGEVRFDASWVLLEADMEWLTPRLRQRAEAMFDGGLVEEALALRATLGAGHRLLQTMGYQEALSLADEELMREAAVERTSIRQRQYAKRQRTWFRKESWWTRLDARSVDVDSVLGAAGTPSPD